MVDRFLDEAQCLPFGNAIPFDKGAFVSGSFPDAREINLGRKQIDIWVGERTGIESTYIVQKKGESWSAFLNWEFIESLIVESNDGITFSSVEYCRLTVIKGLKIINRFFKYHPGISHLVIDFKDKKKIAFEIKVALGDCAKIIDSSETLSQFRQSMPIDQGKRHSRYPLGCPGQNMVALTLLNKEMQNDNVLGNSNYTLRNITLRPVDKLVAPMRLKEIAQSAFDELMENCADDILLYAIAGSVGYSCAKENWSDIDVFVITKNCKTKMVIEVAAKLKQGFGEKIGFTVLPICEIQAGICDSRTISYLYAIEEGTIGCQFLSSTIFLPEIDWKRQKLRSLHFLGRSLHEIRRLLSTREGTPRQLYKYIINIEKMILRQVDINEHDTEEISRIFENLYMETFHHTALKRCNDLEISTIREYAYYLLSWFEERLAYDLKFRIV